MLNRILKKISEHPVILLLGILVTICEAIGLISPGINSVIELASPHFTPPPFHSARTDESLIIVADFAQENILTEGMNESFDWHIFERIRDEVIKQELTDVIRVEWLKETIEGESQARNVGKTYNATLVVWGNYDNHNGIYTVRPKIARIKTHEKIRSKQEGQVFTLVQTDNYSFISTLDTDIPSYTSYLTWFTLGVDRRLAGEYDVAYTYLTHAIDAIPTDMPVSINPSEGYFERGVVAYSKKDYDKVIQDCTKAITLGFEPLSWAYINRGLAYSAQNQYDKAVADFDHALALDPQDVKAKVYNNRGLAYHNQQDYDTAIVNFEEALNLDPAYSEAYYNLGNVYAEQQHYDAAIANFEKAINFNHAYSEAYYNCGNAYYQQQQYDKAVTYYNQAMKLGIEDAHIYNNRGLSYVGQYQYDKAIADFNRAILLDSDYAVVYYNRGDAYKRMGNREKAVADFRRFLDLTNDVYWRDQVKQHLHDLGAEL
jgi:tetratricopeptide (TPR) repeat protein